MSDYKIIRSDELYHYGVPGMRWGHRKAPERVINARNAMRSAKQDKRQANKEYKKAFNKATTLRGAYGKNSNKYSSDLASKMEKSRSADKAYRKAKQAYKSELNAPNSKYTKVQRNVDKRFYGESGVNRINKRMNKGSSRTMATARETGRQMAVATLLIAGRYTAKFVRANGGVKQTGRRVVEAVVRARGGQVIRWVD